MLFLVENAFADQEHLHAGDGIALGIALAFDIGPVEAFVVGKGMGVRPDHVRMHKRRTMPGAAVSHGAHKGRIARDRVGPIYFLKVEVGKTADQAGNVPPAVCTSTGTEMA